MCVAVPMKITSRSGRQAYAEIGGVSREVDVTMVPEAMPGDYIIVHAGFAIERLDEEEALRTLALFEELGEFMDRAEDAHEHP